MRFSSVGHICKTCKKSFLVERQVHLDGGGQYCSRQCVEADHRETRTCKCKVTFLIRKSSGQVYCSAKCFYRHLRSIRFGSNNPMWAGSGVGYAAIHNWARRRLIKPNVCVDCKTKKPHDLANISQEYKRDISDWEWLCRKCHMTKDGRLERFKLNRRPLSKEELSANYKLYVKPFIRQDEKGRFVWTKSR